MSSTTESNATESNATESGGKLMFTGSFFLICQDIVEYDGCSPLGQAANKCFEALERC